MLAVFLKQTETMKPMICFLLFHLDMGSVARQTLELSQNHFAATMNLKKEGTPKSTKPCDSQSRISNKLEGATCGSLSPVSHFETYFSRGMTHLDETTSRPMVRGNKLNAFRHSPTGGLPKLDPHSIGPASWRRKTSSWYNATWCRANNLGSWLIQP